MQDKLRLEIPRGELERLDEAGLRKRLHAAYDDRFRPEMRQMERDVLAKATAWCAEKNGSSSNRRTMEDVVLTERIRQIHAACRQQLRQPQHSRRVARRRDASGWLG